MGLKIDGIEEATVDVTNLAPGESQSVSFTVTRDAAGNYLVEVGGLTGSFTVEDEGAAVSWSIIGGIIGGAVVLGLVLVIFRLISRRRPSKETAS